MIGNVRCLWLLVVGFILLSATFTFSHVTKPSSGLSPYSKRISQYLDQLEGNIVRKTRHDRLDYTMVSFTCSPGQSVCYYDGVGPAITYRKKDVPICTCLCPPGFTQAQCRPSAKDFYGELKAASPNKTSDTTEQP